MGGALAERDDLDLWVGPAGTPWVPPTAFGYSAMFAGVSGMSSITPSMAIIRRPLSQAPGAADPASGRATRADNALTGASPRRTRARMMAPGVGICQAVDQVRPNRQP